MSLSSLKLRPISFSYLLTKKKKYPHNPDKVRKGLGDNFPLSEGGFSSKQEYCYLFTFTLYIILPPFHSEKLLLLFLNIHTVDFCQ